MMKKLLILAVLVAIAVPVAGADYNQGINVSDFTGGYINNVTPQLSEPTVMTDPINPNELLMWAADPSYIYYCYSIDGGNSWVRQATDLPIYMMRTNFFYDPKTSSFWVYGSYHGTNIMEYNSTDRVHFVYRGSSITYGSGWTANGVYNSFEWLEENTYYMLLEGQVGGKYNIGLLSKQDISAPWVSYAGNPVVTNTTGNGVGNPELMRFPNNTPYRSANGTYFMYYHGGIAGDHESAIAASPDKIHWTELSPVIYNGGAQHVSSDSSFVQYGDRAMMLSSWSDMYYTGTSGGRWWISKAVSNSKLPAVPTPTPTPTDPVVHIDGAYSFGAPGWTPITGDWNGDHRKEIGVYKDGVWYLDYNGNGVWDSGIDKAYNFGAAGWVPVVGDWTGDGRDKIGVSNGINWYLDYDGNGVWG
jgi:hypothetical protein